LPSHAHLRQPELEVYGMVMGTGLGLGLGWGIGKFKGKCQAAGVTYYHWQRATLQSTRAIFHHLSAMRCDPIRCRRHNTIFLAIAKPFRPRNVYPATQKKRVGTLQLWLYISRQVPGSFISWAGRRSQVGNPSQKHDTNKNPC